MIDPDYELATKTLGNLRELRDRLLALHGAAMMTAMRRVDLPSGPSLSVADINAHLLSLDQPIATLEKIVRHMVDTLTLRGAM